MTDFTKEIDYKFAYIQKFINERKDIAEEQKENMISLCIECNDMIVKMYDRV